MDKLVEEFCAHSGYDFRRYRDLPNVRRLIARNRALWQRKRLDLLPPEREQEPEN